VQVDLQETSTRNPGPLAAQVAHLLKNKMQ
jgi:hypothetical protein